MKRLAWGLVALILGFGSFGSVINDETSQAIALHNLLNGNLFLQEAPNWLGQKAEGLTNHPLYGGDVPFASMPVNLAAMPVAWSLKLVDAVIPISIAFGLLFVAASWAALRLPWPGTNRLLGRPVATAVAGLGLVLAAGWATSSFRAATPNLDHQLPVVALQTLNMVLFLAIGLLAYRLAGRRIASPAGRLVAVAILVLGPVLFWAQTMKHHTLSIFLLMMALELLDRPASTRRNLALGAVAGIGVWTHLAAGAVLMAGIGIAILVETLRRRGNLKAMGAAALGVVIGLTPFFAENTLYHGNPLLNHYTHPPPPWNVSPTGMAPTGETPTEMISAGNVTAGASVDYVPPDAWLRLADALDWEGPGPWATRLFHEFTTGHDVQGLPVGILAITPLFVFAAWGTVRTLRGKGGAAEWCSIALLATQATLFTNAAHYQGAGFDVRMWSVTLPALALLAWSGLAPTLERLRGVRTVAATTGIASLAGLTVLAAMSAAGWKLAGGRLANTRLFILVWILVLAITALAIVVERIFRQRPLASALPTLVGLSIAPAIMWCIGALLVMHTQILPYQSDPYSGMMVPGMEPFAEALRWLLTVDAPLPVVYVDGQLHFVPDIGLCRDHMEACQQWALDNGRSFTETV